MIGEFCACTKLCGVDVGHYQWTWLLQLLIELAFCELIIVQQGTLLIGCQMFLLQLLEDQVSHDVCPTSLHQKMVSPSLTVRLKDSHCLMSNGKFWYIEIFHLLRFLTDYSFISSHNYWYEYDAQVIFLKKVMLLFQSMFPTGWLCIQCYLYPINQSFLKQLNFQRE